ncbi:hypothetical protein FR483_n634R [Paramecium bursaria Chlorella virus FR483]|uniref:Uncharacterized protein n634R n=1 Tax=Paramecium bursaria Chlorella virus FR483 TaxID=399781 RepID=A7J7Y8_PBCVF|nr:hypothetical protein FR483_n634R [Paramecium bursaria Chlorella virus FR483]ABT15919.1 hypothetical protein FR483_n634R [Paramecium bursaria Chlorella virus FR483]
MHTAQSNGASFSGVAVISQNTHMSWPSWMNLCPHWQYEVSYRLFNISLRSSTSSSPLPTRLSTSKLPTINSCSPSSSNPTVSTKWSRHFLRIALLSSAIITTSNVMKCPTPPSGSLRTMTLKSLFLFEKVTPVLAS